MAYDDADYIESRLIANEQRVSRKDRTCDDCGEPIAAGTTYFRAVGIVDGDLQTRVSHSPHGECGF